MLIGLTGRNAAGKGVVADYLKTKGFYFYSLSDAIRDEVRSRGQSESRELLIQVGNELRHRFGPAVLAERIIAKLDDDKNYVLDSIRNPKEVESFRNAKHFKLIRIEAPIDVRFERNLKRSREGDPLTFEKFLELEKLEARGDIASQNLVAVEQMADHQLENNGSLEELLPRIDELVGRLLREVPRPGWDQYFMD